MFYFYKFSAQISVVSILSLSKKGTLLQTATSLCSKQSSILQQQAASNVFKRTTSTLQHENAFIKKSTRCATQLYAMCHHGSKNSFLCQSATQSVSSKFFSPYTEEKARKIGVQLNTLNVLMNYRLKPLLTILVIAHKKGKRGRPQSRRRVDFF